MQEIEVKTESESEKGWVFNVKIDDIEYEVSLDKEDWQRLVRQPVEAGPEELVRKSFEFLLAREPKEAILRKFNLMEISRYFPEYESVILQ
jgi:hypothetical protein